MKSTSAAPQAERAALPAQIQAQIGRRLSAIYDEVLQQPIPDRFRLLLDELENASPAPAGSARQKGEPS